MKLPHYIKKNILQMFHIYLEEKDIYFFGDSISTNYISTTVVNEMI